MGLNRARLLNNAKYPEMADDYARAFEVLKKLPCDVFLAFHADHFGLVAKKRKLDARTSPNPFLDGPGFRAYLEKNEALFRAQLEKNARPANPQLTGSHRDQSRCLFTDNRNRSATASVVPVERPAAAQAEGERASWGTRAACSPSR